MSIFEIITNKFKYLISSIFVNCPKVPITKLNMDNSYFYTTIPDNDKSNEFCNEAKLYAEDKKELIYLLSNPLTDSKYNYIYENAIIVLVPKHKIIIVDFNDEKESIEFKDFTEDLIEDISSLSDKYNYRKIIGRPREWKEYISIQNYQSVDSFEDILLNESLQTLEEQKKCELLISLFIGSINDTERIKKDLPNTLLEKVKQKIQLFDGDQTRFIYQNKNSKKRISIQGLSGTGKTELLLHKLKELYSSNNESKIYFTCHSKILADNLNKRIPSFFNFMKVEQQIEWNKRLWCNNAWGSYIDSNSGLYSYICNFYDLNFQTYSKFRTFSEVCKSALDELENKQSEVIEYALDYIIIDESQDFDENFFKLCEKVTKNQVYIAGDIFQSIFDNFSTKSIQPDYLLSKCYRTDPKTLMFAHGLGMGLFEKEKIRWLEEKEWKDCGYNVVKRNDEYILSREPVRRFEDISDDYNSIEIVDLNDYSTLYIAIENIINQIKQDNPTVSPNDIAIIFLDTKNSVFDKINALEWVIEEKYKWKVNKAHSTKEILDDTLLISNRYNVKGLEFPFIICITDTINYKSSYRNALYTMLTRSFLKSYLVIRKTESSGFTPQMQSALNEILEDGVMTIEEPDEEEIENIRTRFEYISKNKSIDELVSEIFKEEKLNKKNLRKMLSMINDTELLDADKEKLKEFILYNIKFLP